MTESPKWIQIALAEQGVREIGGPEHNPRIVEYHQATSLAAKEDEVPWCASFVSWVLKEAGLPSPNTARARDFEFYGQPLSSPVLGAIVVMSRGSSPSQGHVGFYVGERGDQVLVLGGNQANAVNISAYPKSRVICYRWPNGVPKPVPETIVEAARTGTVSGAIEQGAIVAGGGAVGTVLASLGAVPVPVALALIGVMFVLGVIWIAHKRFQKARGG